jgi:hypothetical protein
VLFTANAAMVTVYTGIHSGWERFKEMAQGTLRIRDVTEEDSGHYTCRAANGFGSISIEHDLYVIGE